MELIGGPDRKLPVPGKFVLPLIGHRRESPSAITFRFSTEGTGFTYLSNQAVRMALPGVDDPWGAARLFSLSSSPSEPGELAVTCRISDTPFKQALARLAPGQTAEVYGPMGSFLLDVERPAVFLAGGIGITPFRGMVRYAADVGVSHRHRLLYSARVPEELLFRSEFDAIARRSDRFSAQYSITRPGDSTAGWDGRVGRIDERWVRSAIAGIDRPRFYLAGLPEMVRDTVQLLTRLEVPEDDIDYEVFRGF